MKKIYFAVVSFLFMITASMAQPVITKNPVDAIVCIDSCVSFSVSAVGNSLSYNWFVADSAAPTLVGVGNSIELCDSLVQYDQHEFYCIVVDNNGDSATSSSASLTLDSCLAPIADFEFVWNHMEICFESTSKRAETVFWLFGDGKTDANNNDSICHTYDTKELYYVKLIAFNDYGEDEIEKPIDLLSAEELDASESFSFFPNPAINVVNIQSSERIESLQLFSVDGSLVRMMGIQSTSARIDINELDAGVYIMKVHTASDIIQQRILIQ
ncbi:MAG: T9SS type A sorting domain-containing protein [Salibacteraceae bacterium]